MKKMLLGGSGALVASGGATLLAYNHWAWLQPMLPDAGGVTAIAIGAGLGAAAFRDGSSSSSDTKDSKSAKQYEFELVPLNDDARYKATLEAVGAPSSSEQDATSTKAQQPLHAELAIALEVAESKEAEAAKKAKEVATKALVDELKTALEDGSLTPRRLRQKMRPRVFVLDFDTRPPPPSAGRPPPRPPSMRELLDGLKEQVSFLLHVASPFDEVVLRVTSPGGSAADYGLAAAHFARFKEAGVTTTACVDTVAASGGYMLACTAHRILAAPFSIVGSIGVIASVPNVHKLLDHQGVEMVQRTAGEHKRTVNIFTPNTPEGLQKFEEDLQIVHDAFIAHVTSNRPVLDPRKVCTGETWLGINAEALGLIDGLSTSDAYLRTRQLEADVVLVQPKPPSRAQGLYALLNRVDSAVSSVAHAAAFLTRVLPAAPFGASAVSGDVRTLGGVATAGVRSAAPNTSLDTALSTAAPIETLDLDHPPGLATAAERIARAPLLHAGGGGPLEGEARRRR